MSSPIASGHPPTARRSSVQYAENAERRVIGGLHPLHAVDPEPVVPLLHPRHEAGQRVLGDQRSGTGADVLPLRLGRQAGDEVRQRLALQQGVRVDRDGDRGRHGLERRVERLVFAGLLLDDPPIVEP
jgi:hypothetical protein